MNSLPLPSFPLSGRGTLAQAAAGLWGLVLATNQVLGWLFLGSRWWLWLLANTGNDSYVTTGRI